MTEGKEATPSREAMFRDLVQRIENWRTRNNDEGRDTEAGEILRQFAALAEEIGIGRVAAHRAGAAYLDVLDPEYDADLIEVADFGENIGPLAPNHAPPQDLDTELGLRVDAFRTALARLVSDISGLIPRGLAAYFVSSVVAARAGDATLLLTALRKKGRNSASQAKKHAEGLLVRRAYYQAGLNGTKSIEELKNLAAIGDEAAKKWKQSVPNERRTAAQLIGRIVARAGEGALSPAQAAELKVFCGPSAEVLRKNSRR